MVEFLLCLALLGDPSTPAKIDRRGCRLAPVLVEVAQQNGLHPALLTSMGRTETGLQASKRSPGGHCGLIQAHPRYTRLSCKQMRDPKTGLEAGVKILLTFQRSRACKGDMRCALRRYSGSRKGNYVYSDEVLKLTNTLQDRMEPPALRDFQIMSVR